jgi:hypothetical protein
MTGRYLFPTIVAFLLLGSCSKQSGGQRATVQMRDGTEVSGTVVSSSASEIQLAGDDKVTRTIPMAQVRSVEYEQPAPTPAPSSTSANSREPRHRDHFHPTESAVTSTTRLLPAGTLISVRNEETIDSGKAAEGQTFPAEITKDVLDAARNVVIPRGANAQIIIRSVSKGGKVRGASDLVLDLASISIDGRRYEISTADLGERGRSGVGANRRTAEYTGGGAAIGAIIGAIAGGGKGAAIGAGSGAGAGALTQILTKGTIKVPVESVLTFELDKPLRVESAH